MNEQAHRAGRADRLSLAATPVFVLMAVLTVVSGADHVEVHHASGPGAWRVNEMALMYVLMSVFHATPWLKRFVTRRKARRYRAAAGARPAVK